MDLCRAEMVSSGERGLLDVSGDKKGEEGMGGGLQCWSPARSYTSVLVRADLMLS